jgi:hypothetical protein
VKLLKVTNPNNIGAQQTAITDTLNKIKTAFSQPVGATCAAWYQTSGVSPLLILDGWTPASNYGYANFNMDHNDKAAFAGIVNPDGDPNAADAEKKPTPIGVPETWAFTVNLNNLFFSPQFIFGGRVVQNAGIGPRNYKGLTVPARATVLLHELAHIMHLPNFLSDFANPKQGPLNDQLVDTNCKDMIESLP